MICNKHPKFKGAKLGKKNAECPDCNKIFKISQEEREKKRKDKFIYSSMTTPGHMVDLAHIIAESITMMKFGIQCEKFWTQESSTQEEIKSFFFNSLKLAHIWINTKQWAANALKGLFYISIINNQIKQNMQNLNLEIIKEKEVANSSININKSTLSDCKMKKNPYSILSES